MTLHQVDLIDLAREAASRLDTPRRQATIERLNGAIAQYKAKLIEMSDAQRTLLRVTKEALDQAVADIARVGAPKGPVGQ